VRGVVNALIIMTVVYTLALGWLVLPHHPCDALTTLPWLRCQGH
jgi:hypothetical protein